MRFKVAREHDLKVHGLKFAGVGEGFLGAPADGTETAGQRKRKRSGDALHPVMERRRSSIWCVNAARSSGVLPAIVEPQKLKGQQTVWIEARVDALQLEEAAEHQAGTDEQNKRECHFGDDHELA